MSKLVSLQIKAVSFLFQCLETEAIPISFPELEVDSLTRTLLVYFDDFSN